MIQASSPIAGQPAPAPAMAAVLIGCIEPFDASANDWETYAARFRAISRRQQNQGGEESCHAPDPDWWTNL